MGEPGITRLNDWWRRGESNPRLTWADRGGATGLVFIVKLTKTLVLDVDIVLEYVLQMQLNTGNYFLKLLKVENQLLLTKINVLVV